MRKFASVLLLSVLGFSPLGFGAVSASPVSSQKNCTIGLSGVGDLPGTLISREGVLSCVPNPDSLQAACQKSATSQSKSPHPSPSAGICSSSQSLPDQPIAGGFPGH